MCRLITYQFTTSSPPTKPSTAQKIAKNPTNLALHITQSRLLDTKANCRCAQHQYTKGVLEKKGSVKASQMMEAEWQGFGESVGFGLAEHRSGLG
jgi:hypothetical protein